MNSVNKMEIIKYYEIFKQTDKDNSGNLNINEFKEILENSDKIFTTINDNNDRKIDIYEFLTFLLTKPTPFRAKKENESSDDYDNKIKDRHSKYKNYINESVKNKKPFYINRLQLHSNPENFAYFKEVFKDMPIPDDYISVAPKISNMYPIRKTGKSSTPSRRSSKLTGSTLQIKTPRLPVSSLKTNLKGTLSSPLPSLTPRTTTRIQYKIKIKIGLIQRFNENLKKFQLLYNTIKGSIIDMGQHVVMPNINSNKLNQIINSSNRSICTEKLNISNFRNLSTDNLDKSIQIFIILCYTINELNCILNVFNDGLKDQYKADKRFGNNEKPVEYLKQVLQGILNQRNNINEEEFKIKEETMKEVCEKIKEILKIISDIFKGIHDDLNITLIEEIIGNFNKLLKNTNTTIIRKTNREAYNELIKEIDFDFNTEFQKSVNVLNTGKQITNDTIDEFIKFYDLLEGKKVIPKEQGKNSKVPLSTPRKNQSKQSKQKILQSIRNKVIKYSQDNKGKLPNYKFLDAITIYKDKE